MRRSCGCANCTSGVIPLPAFLSRKGVWSFPIFTMVSFPLVFGSIASAPLHGECQFSSFVESRRLSGPTRALFGRSAEQGRIGAGRSPKRLRCKGQGGEAVMIGDGNPHEIRG